MEETDALIHLQPLGIGPDGKPLFCYVTPLHSFGADAFLLADFCKARPQDHATDLGAGCGILSFLLYKRYNLAKIYGLEIQNQAFRQFMDAVKGCDLETRIFPVEGDFQTAPFPELGSQDLVVSNPPYFLPRSDQKEARSAAREEILCSLDGVCAAAARLLRFGGRFCLCYRPSRLPDLISSLRNHRLEPKRMRFAAEREGAEPFLVLMEARLGGKPSMQVEPAFYLRDPGGSERSEYKNLYENGPF